jgi:CRP/FNR family cyclic AMP-dependent transcriptional regulator
VFAHWPVASLRELAQSARLQRYPRGSQLVTGSSHRRDIFVVASGLVEVAATNARGDKHILSVVWPGQITRLVQLLEDEPQFFSFCAREEAQVVRIPGAAMRRILDVRPELWQSVAVVMLTRYRLSAEVMQDQVLASTRRRVAIMLNILAHRYRDQMVDGACFDLHISQTDLANMLGLARQTVGKELARLKAEGVLGSSYRQITVLDVPALQRVAAEG